MGGRVDGRGGNCTSALFVFQALLNERRRRAKHMTTSCREKSEAYLIFASNFLADAKCVAANGLHSFNVTSWTDTGSFTQTVNLSIDDPNPHIASGLHSTAYFAVGHAIELLLKAFLLGKGLSEKVLEKDLRHDLKKAVALSEAHGLRFAYTKQVVEFSEYHRRLLFRYPKEPLTKMPPVEDLIMLTTELEHVVLCSRISDN